MLLADDPACVVEVHRTTVEQVDGGDQAGAGKPSGCEPNEEAYLLCRLVMFTAWMQQMMVVLAATLLVSW